MNRQRPARVRAAPARLHDEQASQHEVAALLAQFRNPVAPAVVSSDSDEETDTDSGPEEGEERKEGDRRPPARPWSDKHSPVRPLAFCPPRRPVHSFEEDQLSKLRGMIDMLTTAIRAHHYPGEELTVDEAMVLFKGRSSMRQHIAKKASPTGFKVWMLVDVKSNYVYSFDIYTGKNKMKREEGLTAAVVLKLIEPLTEHCWHRIGMDGFFTSVELFKQLLSKGFYAVGTTHHDRKHFPKQQLLLEEVARCQRGEYVWRQNGPMVCFSWNPMDKKPVNLLSTFCDALEKSTIKRRTGKELIDVECPSVVPAYLRTMRGVDVFAQRQSYSKIGRRSKKWFYSLVWFMFDVAIHNAFILQQTKRNQQNYTEKDFRKHLMEQLIDGFSSRKAKGRAAPARKRRLDVVHSIGHHDTAGACAECRVHVGRGRNNRRSRYRCEDCQVYLCMPACYNQHVQALIKDEADMVDE